jgi:DNA-binding NarL/FixJ family response regulator
MSTQPTLVTTLAVVEDDLGIRTTLQRMLATVPQFQVLAAYDSTEDALIHLPKVRPNVVLMDINLPNRSGIECTARLRAMLPATQVLMLTVYEDTDTIFKALRAGASGYLLKRSDPEEIIEAINDVVIGGSPMTSEIARKVVASFREPTPNPELACLQRREEEILELLSKGFLVKEIAESLHLSVNTIKTHLRRIYEKLHVRSRTEAVVKFLNS